MEWSVPFQPLSSSSIRFGDARAKIELAAVCIWHFGFRKCCRPGLTAAYGAKRPFAWDMISCLFDSSRHPAAALRRPRGSAYRSLGGDLGNASERLANLQATLCGSATARVSFVESVTKRPPMPVRVLPNASTRSAGAFSSNFGTADSGRSGFGRFARIEAKLG